mmetsp:Transcript_35952/g.49910  ORF Transcript_35952/g.49910 Transcript_35952/m.49910 type:complete len:204 (-) Transcript_35952:82-693(-)|eukprot:CAMPEP_0196584218 /NCGR_PEP_ID=MMETSP1081-20130531/46243_1 /TAXON_ID=36882 /ORGANISM="Pyramimonas amylifera, Strain CCMP720" /LENGTH=203 /DNA_ID=CAMNT_0041905353 /DNA_START=179 /DNA_END=790 /DNA_ORIENTATION=+
MSSLQEVPLTQLVQKADVVLEDTFNVVLDYCSDVVEDFSKALRNVDFASDETTYKLLNQGVHRVHNKLEARCSECLGRFLDYSRAHCFSLPAGLLPTNSDRGLNAERDRVAEEEEEEEERALDAELDLLRCRLAAANAREGELRRLRHSLEEEKAKCGAVSSALQDITNAELSFSDVNTVTEKENDLQKYLLDMHNFENHKSL